MFKTLCFILILAVVVTGCAVMPAGVAPSAHQMDTQLYQVLGKSSGEASHFTLFNIIPFGKADIEQAVQEAIRKKGGDNLINVRYWQKTTWVFIGYLTTFHVEGDVIKYTQ